MTRKKKRFPQLLYLLTALVCLALAGISLLSSGIQAPTDSLLSPDELKLSPRSYANNLVIPYNIAPLNFQIENEAYDFITCYSSKKGKPLLVKGKNVQLKKNDWRQLLENNKGEELLITVFVKRDGVWFHYPSVRYQIALEPIDTWILFRTSQPVFSDAGDIVLVQRNLETYKEKSSVFHRQANNQGNAESAASLFPAFHPTLPLYANTVDQRGTIISFMNTESSSSLNEGAFIHFNSTEKGQVEHQSTLPAGYPGTVEAFPSWSMDGKQLFSCLANTGNDSSSMGKPAALYLNLVHRSFSPTASIGPADTLVNAAQLRKSVATPRLSPDGKRLLFCMTDNGNKPLWHKSSDVYMLDMATGSWMPLITANSPEVDNQPCWSSNGRWILFCSNRTDGTYTRLFIAYCDQEGMVHNAFILPQRNPSRDEQTFLSYNTPEFLSKPNSTSQLRLMAYLLETFDD